MPLPALSLTSWAGLAATAALIGSSWRTIAGWFRNLADLVVGRVVLQDESARAMLSYVWANGRRSPFGLKLFGGTTSFVYPRKRVEVVGYESISNEPLVFWFGRAPVLVAAGFKSAENYPVSNWNSECPPVTIRFLRGTFDADKAVKEAIATYNDIRQNREKTAKSVAGPRRFNVIRMHGPGRRGSGGDEVAGKKNSNVPIGGSGGTDLVTKIQRKEVRLLSWEADDLIERSTDALPFSNHPIPQEMLGQFDEIYTLLQREEWFRSRGIRWGRGYLLWGPTGSGKSTIVRNIAIRHDLPLFTFDISSYDNQSFADDWKRVQQNAPAIALLEDLDVTYRGRENVAVKDKTRDCLSFDALLNTISGVGSADGVILFATANHIENLDPALGVPVNGDSRSTRPGRIDRAIYVGPMGEAERRKVAEIVLDEWPDLIEPTVAAGDGQMAAQFQETCARLALERFWREHEEQS